MLQMKRYIKEKPPCSISDPAIVPEPYLMKTIILVLMFSRKFQNNTVYLNFYVELLVSIIGASWTRNSTALNILIW